MVSMLSHSSTSILIKKSVYIMKMKDNHKRDWSLPVNESVQAYF